MKDGKVRGWFNHYDSYAGGMGKNVISVYQKYTQAQIRAFFLKNLTLIDAGDFDAMTAHEKIVNKKKSPYLHLQHGSKTEYEYNERAIYGADWTRPWTWHEDKENFYKDAIFCEYSYIFDLDSKEKRLLVFTGFGKKPSKGYEDWRVESSNSPGPGLKHYVYMQYCGSLKGPYPDETYPYILLEAMTQYPLLKKVLTCPPKTVLTYVNYKSEDDNSHLDDLIKQVVEYRMAGKGGIPHLK